MPKTERGAFFVPEEQLVEMVKRMKNGDEQAEEDMQKMFKGYLSRYFYTKARSCHIDKLVSNTFYQVNKSIHKLEEPAAFVSWIKTIAHREVYHFYREIQKELEQEEKEKKRKESKKERAMRRFSGIDVSDDRVVAIVNALPKKQKEVVLLRAEGLKMREIAAIQGVPEGTVKSRINYAKKKMKAEWRKLQAEELDA